MIFVTKNSRRLVEGVQEIGNKLTNMPDCLYNTDGPLERLYTESEVEERVKEAVKEHEQRIAELEAERKPVEVSEADAAAIEWYKKFNFFWERDMINGTARESSPHRDTIDEWTYAFVRDVIKRGYTVKPDPIRADLSALLQKLNDEQISEKEYLDQLTEYAHGLQSRTQADS